MILLEPMADEPVHVYVHVKCAAPYRRKEQQKEKEISELKEKIYHLDYLAGAARGKAHDSINQRALRRQRRLKRRLLEMRQGPGWTEPQWQALKRKYHHRCLCCRKKGLQLEPDHIEPIEKGGAHHINNIQPLCKDCNMRKGARYHDYRPSDVREWERQIRGLCQYASLTPQRCKRLALESGIYCAVHKREHNREITSNPSIVGGRRTRFCFPFMKIALTGHCQPV
jgi:5-methylcytosine-specific restriction endonuclease McrA